MVSSAKNPVSTRTAFIIQAVTITIGFLILGLGVWLMYLSTRPAGPHQTSTATFSPGFTALKIVVGSLIIGPVIAHVGRKYGEHRARKWLILGALIILLVGLAISMIHLHSAANKAVELPTLQ